MKFLTITVLTAGLFTGSAALAQEFVQQTATSYALTLIDAGDGTETGTKNSKTGGAVTDATTHVRVKVTVSVPRTSAAYGNVSIAARPTRLMYRRHKGFSTAFDGSISLTRDAPYAADGTSLTTAFYPMPQADSATGLSIQDPIQLDYAAVVSGQQVNVDGQAYDDPETGYTALGQAHDPARWESTYLSPVYHINDAEFSTKHPMIYSLLAGDAAYEWYAASFYGIGFSRISPIQDLGRAMSFTDVRLWEPTDTGTNASEDAARITDSNSQLTLGTDFEWRLRAMPETNDSAGWHIYRGSIGSNYSGVAGAQLLNLTGGMADHSDSARIESPLYPDGVGSITFQAMATGAAAGEPQQLLVQCSVNDIWQPVETVQLTGSLATYTVDFKGVANGPARFRLVRISQLDTAGDANLSTMIIRDLLVRSAAPQATFGKPAFFPAQPSYYTYDNTGALENVPFDVIFNAVGGTAEAVKPRGYAATLSLRRRAEGDTTRQWRTAPVEVRAAGTNGTPLAATFSREPLLTNPDGSVNAAEGAFFLNPAGDVTGLMPGVYDLALNYQIYGSFKAGRSIIDEHESVDGVASAYGVSVTGDDGTPETEYRPNVLDLREQETAHERVWLRVMYRSGTTDNAAPYTVKTLEVPLLPSAREPHLWRVDLARILKLEDETAVYAWGYEPPAGSDESPIFVENVLAFTVCAATADGGTVCYGQKGSVAPGVLPAMTAVVPAFTETLAKGDADKVIPMVLDLASLANSHVMVELTLPEIPDSDDDIFARVGGSYWQDFNTWYAPSDNFTETDFRENVRSRTADFDCVVEEVDGEYEVTSGWIPDEGPLADTTAFTDSFEVGREAIDNSAFYLRDLTYQVGNGFASWGASSTHADLSYLYRDFATNRYQSDYLKLNGGTGIVLNRIWRKQSTDYLADAQIRLSGKGNGISPIPEGVGGVVLNGVGTVSFTLGLSIPYDIDHRVRLLSTDEANPFRANGFGIAAGVQFDRPAETCASSGYSVSYFLENFYDSTKFELRLTQIVDFDNSTNNSQPSPVVVAELYKWTGSGPTRLPLTGATSEDYHRIGSSLAGNSYGLWIDASGYLRVGHVSGSTTPNSLSRVFSSRDAVANPETAIGYTLALGSAECRPIFRQLLKSTAASNDFSGGILEAPTFSDVALNEPSIPIWSGETGSWNLKQDATSSTRIQISRRTPPAELAGRVRISAEPNASGIVAVAPRTVSTDKTGTTFSVTLGAANSTLEIVPDGEECNVFLDNITVSSWCGNDANRNGNARVPKYTDEGFFAVNGFAGVGVWIRPESADQVTATPAEYRGNQCLLMQRSRQNISSGLSGEMTTGDITHTGSSLAVYTPYSDEGFGPVSFRYCIPSEDEYAGTGALPPVYVMLQFHEENAYYNNYLSGDAPVTWVNVSDPVELKNTDGEWLTASITPKRNGEELVGTRGTLRLVMVTTGLEADDDPYVYLDDLTVTNNAEGTLASWSARNVKLTDTPVSQLYWKDRAATASADPAEETFAEKSSLTRALQFNDVLESTDTDGRFDTCVLNSPILENGVGRLTFAARLTEENPEPVRLYILASESDGDADMAAYTPVTYVEVTNTVYTVYDIDLSKFKTWYTKPTADLQPGESNTTEVFSAAATRRLRLRTYLEGDGATTDHFGTSAENRTPNTGRILIDALSISDPVLPSLRIESVAFSNVAGSNSAAEFVRNSPLSQPVSNAPALRAMVELGHMQLLKDDSIRVFLTMNPHNITNPTASVKRYTAGYEYTDVMGNTVSASDGRPLYGWDQNLTALERWPLSAWFKLNELYTPDGGVKDLTAIQALYPHTVELKRQPGSNLFFDTGDLSDLGLKELPVNSLVQYTAWAVYQSEETNQYFAAQITPATHTDFPWYFPRNLNTEIQAQTALARLNDSGEEYSEENLAKHHPGTNFFSPYYWVYSCQPGEVFVNEFDLRNIGDATHGADAFVEVCAPAGLDIGEWKLSFTARNGTAPEEEMTWVIDSGTAMKQPDPGAVPEMRKTASSANRAFYTVFSNESPVFTREGGAEGGSPVTALDAVADTPNGGVASRGWGYVNLGGNMAVSVHLQRPTGGAEHIVVFSMADQTTIRDSHQQAVDTLYNTYLGAYASKGFGSEWYQTFLDGSWEKYISGRDDAFGTIALNESDLDQVKAHGRRLTKANYFPSDGASKDYRFNQAADTFEPVQDVANAAVGNSIATIDMGGMWVTRRNAVDTNAAGGPLDLTELCYGTWPSAQNPTLMPRAAEPVPAEIPTGAVAPYTQVTPRQINPDQYLVKYTGLAQSIVVSAIGGNALGTHQLEIYEGDTEEIVETRRAGRTSPNTWSMNLSVEKVRLTYTALPFQCLDTVQVRLVDAKSGDPLTEADAIGKQIAGQPFDGPYADGWITLTGAPGTTAFSVTAILPKAASAAAEDRYNMEAKAVFKVNPDSAATDVITKVSPYCGGTLGGSALYQPWWGSGFGFTVAYDESKTEGATFSGALVTYPSPAGLVLQGNQWQGLQSPWAGLTLTYTPDPVEEVTPPDETVSLIGKEYDEAIELLKTVFGPKGNTRFVEIRSAADGLAADTSLIGILSDSYARAMGYDGTAKTADKKEPAIPFCVWGIYTYTVQGATGTEKVTFLMPQAAPGEKAGLFETPAWYTPADDPNAGSRSVENTAPYFYLYSTPPQSAWLNEVNLHKGPADGPGTDPYVEVVMPRLREGILNAMTETLRAKNNNWNDGWSVCRYLPNGTPVSVGLGDVTPVNSNSSSYTYNVMDIPTLASDATAAYVLVRPCGAAEGGVWLYTDAAGDTPVTIPTGLEWLSDPTNYFVVPGVTDATAAAGSVQLVGKTVHDGDFERISSAVADRTEWTFADESKNDANDGISPDTKPEWNRVTVTSSLRNTVYGGVFCGYQAVPGYFKTADATGSASTDGPITLTLGGSDWVYDSAAGRTLALSYRPRTNYRFESMALPPDLIGNVILIGRDGGVSEAVVAEEVARLKQLEAEAPTPEAKAAVRRTEWIRMGTPDTAGVFRAEVEYTTDDTGAQTPSGVIRFNPGYIASAPTADEVITFGEQSGFVITLVFVTEPASAQNRIEVAMGQGDVQLGAWLASQTLWAWGTDAAGDPSPDPDKGGDTVSFPIWSDADGNINGDYKNVHGWIHQPVTGDRLGMSAVINPELGLVGGLLGSTLEEVRTALEADASLRPFLVWTLIPKSKVPKNLFDVTLGEGDASRSAFLQNWALPNWIGGSPAVGDRTTVSLRTLRKNLKTTAELDSGFYSAAGIIPMKYSGYCGTDRELGTDPEQVTRAETTLLAFSTMSETELTDALALPLTGLSNEDPDLLPYTAAIDMSDAALWQDGAVLRFAVVIADASPMKNAVYDCQELANFSSDELDAYCPWYVPDVDSNINRVTSAESFGVSPFAWVYSIAQGGVWLNEIRPFATVQTTGENTTVVMPSAVELAMYASPYTVDPADLTYRPANTLDGWKLEMKYAPMPLLGTAEETPINWITHRTVDLVGWIPYRRIDPDYDTTLQGNNPNYYDLDFYCATTSVDAGFAIDKNGSLKNFAYGPETLNTFKWLRLAEELFDPGLEAELRKSTAYQAGVVYAVALVRNNGVVTDEVLFYTSIEGLNSDDTRARVQLAIDSENVNNRVAGRARGVTDLSLPLGDVRAAASAQFVEWKNSDGETGLYWIVEDSESALNTFPGANVWGNFLQPYVTYDAAFTTYSLLTARILGSDALLSLAQANGVGLTTGPAVSAAYATGTAYTLTLSDWNRKWFALESVQKNGRPLDAALKTGTVYALNSAGLLSTSQSITVDDGLLLEDTDYSLTFVYTPAAAQLADSGALIAEDDGFLAWLLKADPDAILKKSSEDGVTASEKYWLGLDSAAVDAGDVDLAITAIGTHTEPVDTDRSDAEPAGTLPVLSVALTRGETEIRELTGDGVLVLLGRETVDEPWQYVRRLYPEDVNGDTHLILRTPCTLFKAILLSAKQAEDYK